MLLRRWVARERGADESDLFGPLPEAKITLTHDLDAISKRLEIRFKQGAFHLWNGCRYLARRELGRAAGRAAAAARFVLGPDDLWMIDDLVAAVTRRGLRSRIHVYGGPAGWHRGWPGVIMDPGYDCAAPRVMTMLRHLAADGFEIGLHPGFSTWRSARLIGEQRARLAHAVGRAATSCRRDPGAVIEHWISEVRAVGGVASVLWHPHTLHPDYGWRAGFEALLEILAPH
jgi:hypothetical protein